MAKLNFHLFTVVVLTSIFYGAYSTPITPGISKDIAIRASGQQESTSLAIRGPDSLGPANEKRGLVAGALAAGAFVASLAVAKSIVERTCGPPEFYEGIWGSIRAGLTCIVGVSAAVAVSLAGVAGALAVGGVSLIGRDSANSTHPLNMNHLYPPKNNQSTVAQLRKAYNGSEILVAHSLCHGNDCHEVYYSNSKLGNQTNLVHRLSRRPRNGKKSKRDGLQTESPPPDGGIYGSYMWYNTNAADDTALATDPLFPGDFATIFNNPLFSNEGVYCMNIHDPLDNNALSTVGVATFQMGSEYEWTPSIDGVTVPGTAYSDLQWCKQEHHA